MSVFTRVAHVVRTKNLGGSVVCREPDGLPFRMQEGMQVHFVPPTLRGPRTATVESIKDMGEGLWLVRFAEIDTVGDAQNVCGCLCLAEATVVLDVVGTRPFEHMLGCTLVDAHVGEVGTIVDVLAAPIQSLLVVRADEGEVLVPAVDAFIGSVDEQARTVHATLPHGLLELGRKGS